MKIKNKNYKILTEEHKMWNEKHTMLLDEKTSYNKMVHSPCTHFYISCDS